MIHKIGDIIEKFIHRYDLNYLNHWRNKKAIERLERRHYLNNPVSLKIPKEEKHKSIEQYVIEGQKMSEQGYRNSVDSASDYQDIRKKEQSAGCGSRIYEEFFGVTRKRDLMWSKRGRLVIVVSLSLALYLSSLWLPAQTIPIIGVSLHLITVILLWQNEA